MEVWLLTTLPSEPAPALSTSELLVTLGLGLLRALRESTLSYYGKGDPKNFFLLFSPTMWSPQENQIVREGHCGLIVSP